MPNIAISHLDVNDGGFVAVTPPTPCRCLVVENSDRTRGFLIRTTQHDPDTERAIEPGSGVEFRSDGAAFQPGSTVAYASITSGAGELILTAGMGMQMALSGGSVVVNAEAPAAANISLNALDLAMAMDQILLEIKRLRRAMEIQIDQEVMIEDVD